MRMMTATGVERRQHRSRLDHPELRAGSFRRGELAAALAAVAVVAQLALAPVSLLVAGVLVATGRISRWQLSWLLLPAVSGVGWLAVAGLPAAAHALAIGAGRLMAAELAVAAHPQRLLHPAAAFAGSGRLLQQELPLLVLAGTAEAAIVLGSAAGRWPGRFGRRSSSWQPLAGAQAPAGRRPGLVAVLRRRSAAAALAAGHSVTGNGFGIGVDYRSGRLAAVSWAQAERGVLLTGGDPTELDQIGLAITCAAMRRRKAVLVLDLVGRDHVSCDRGDVSWAWDQVSCNRDHVSRARGARAPFMPRSVVNGCMKGARPAQLDGRGASVCAQVAGLAERVGVPVRHIGSVADRTPAMPGARTSVAVLLNGAFGRAIRGRSVILVPAHQPAIAQPEAAQPEAAQPEAAQPEAARQIVSELIATLTALRELGLRGDSLVWVSGCEAAEPGLLSDLLALGHATGTAVVLSTTSPGIAADLAAEGDLVVASGPITGNLAQRLADLAVGNSATGPAMGHELPIDAPLWASIDNRRPSAPEPAARAITAKHVFTDILHGQHRNSARLIAGGTTFGPVSFRTVPPRLTEVR